MGPGIAMEKSSNFKGTIKRFLKEMWHYRLHLVPFVLLSLIAGIVGSLAPKYVGDATQILYNGFITQSLPAGLTQAELPAYLEAHGQSDLLDMLTKIDFSVRGIDWPSFLTIIATVTCIYLLVFLTRWMVGWLARLIIARYSRELRSQIQSKTLSLPLSYLDAHQTGEILSRTTNDIDNIVGNLNIILSQMMVSITLVLSILVMMFVVSWHLALIAIASVAVSMLFLRIIAKRAQPYFRSQWKITGQLNGHIEEYFSGHNIVSLFNQKSQVSRKFNRLNEDLYRTTFRAQVLSSLIQPTMNLVTNLNYVILASVGALGIINGWMTLGAVQSAIMYSRGYSQPLSDISAMMNQLQSTAASLERVYEFLDQPDQTPDVVPEYTTGQVSTQLPAQIQGQVDFDHIKFAYSPDQPLIDDLSLSVRPGQSVAIVGKTGAGKTTLVNLLMRFYDIEAGDIRLDGTSIYSIARSDLRRNLGMVLQDTWLFSGTIRQNLLYGLKEGQTISDADFLAIARATNVDQFVQTFPLGYDSPIDDSESQLSEGQRQLLTICRALISKPSIIILDEATSSVDTRTEVLVQEAMNRLREGRTSFVIAHRLSTILNSDIILVMDQGTIVEQGSHQELLQLNGYYAKLYNAQYNRDAGD
jgi:ATP-binding cassette subfamily B protein